mmetsp:Transcript_3945/g.10884  ORF Transcript_3945/g.10884 Transcript_3945/m.10884 type:complete len:184 (+) Transcript_3945:1390-1941(+)
MPSRRTLSSDTGTKVSAVPPDFPEIESRAARTTDRDAAPRDEVEDADPSPSRAAPSVVSSATRSDSVDFFPTRTAASAGAAAAASKERVVAGRRVADSGRDALEENAAIAEDDGAKNAGRTDVEEDEEEAADANVVGTALKGPPAVVKARSAKAARLREGINDEDERRIICPGSDLLRTVLKL